MTQQKHRGGWKREQRYLYALLFPGRRCYIGQTTRPQQRWSEHRRAWHEPFTPLLLGSVVGTYEDAVDYEHAWRWKAQQAGYAVLATDRAGDHFVLHNLMRQMTPTRFALVSFLRWPRERRSWRARGWLRWIGWAAATSAGLLLVLHNLLRR